MIYVVFICILTLYLRSKGFGIFAVGEHPVLITLLVKYFVFLIPAIIVTNIDGLDLVVHSSTYGISSESLDLGNLYLLINLFFFVIVFSFFVFCFGKIYLNYEVVPSVHTNGHFKSFVLLLFSLQLAWLTYSLYMGDAKPMLYLLQGDFQQANIAKKDIIEGVAGSKLPIVSYLPKYLFVFAPMFIYYVKHINSSKFYGVLFIVSMLFSVFYFIASGHKAPLLFFMIYFYIFKCALKKSGIATFIRFFIFLLVVGGGGYLISFGFLTEASFGYGLHSLLERIFVGQSQGLYYIIEYIEPSFKYLSSWVPFSSLFFDEVVRADIEVVSIAFPDSQSYSNMNTIFIGEAYSVLGFPGVLFSSLVVWLFVFSVAYYFREKTKSTPLFFVPLSFCFFSNIPIAQGVSYFFLPKELFVCFLFFLFLYFFYARAEKGHF